MVERPPESAKAAGWSRVRKDVTSSADLGGEERRRPSLEVRVVVTGIYLVFLASYPRTAVLDFLPWTIFPLGTLIVEKVPLRTMARWFLTSAPFLLAVAIPNFFLDSQSLRFFGKTSISVGAATGLSLLVRGSLAVLAAVALAAPVPFPDLCVALRRLHVPDPLVLQVLILHRYIAVLQEEAAGMLRAFRIRSRSRRGPPPVPAAALLGSLLVRSLERSRRLYLGMAARGFKGRIPLPQGHRFGIREGVYSAGWLSLFGILRFLSCFPKSHPFFSGGFG